MTGPNNEAPHLTYLMPALDEERRLAKSLERLIAYAAAQPYAVEIIVVDDGSTDSTAEIAREAASALPANVSFRLLQHEANRGKGAAVRTGALAAQGDYVLTFDADLAMPPEEAYEDPHFKARGFQVEVHHPELGRTVRYPGAPYRLTRGAWRISRRAPRLGEHTEEVLRELGDGPAR